MVASPRVVKTTGVTVASHRTSLVYDSSEERSTNPSRVTLYAHFEGHALPLLTRISSYSRLVRVTTWILRFVYNLRHPQRKQGAFSARELKGAEVHWLKEVQQFAYRSELRIFHFHKSLPRTNRLINFRHFMDNEGVLRVGGRMQRGNYPMRKDTRYYYQETTRW